MQVRLVAGLGGTEGKWFYDFKFSNFRMKRTDHTFSLVHPNPTSDGQQLWEQEVLKYGFFCYQVVAGLGSVRSPMAWKLVPRTGRSAVQAVDLQKTQQLLFKFHVNPEIHFLLQPWSQIPYLFIIYMDNIVTWWVLIPRGILFMLNQIRLTSHYLNSKFIWPQKLHSYTFIYFPYFVIIKF